MNSMAYAWGFITGLAIVTIIALVVALIAKKKFKQTTKFDERQKLLRSQAYQVAFWVLIGYLCANGLFSLATGMEWADLMTNSFIGICIAMTVFVVICIKNDAYFAINQRPWAYMALFSVLIIVNLAMGLFNVIDEDTSFFTDGMLNYHAMSFVVALMLFVGLIALIARRIHEKRKNAQADHEELEA